jgi:hypothetical protein
MSPHRAMVPHFPAAREANHSPVSRLRLRAQLGSAACASTALPSPPLGRSTSLSRRHVLVEP